MNVNEWIVRWLELFPKGIKNDGGYIRSNLAGCLKKMEKFCLAHPEFTSGIIITATKKYIDEKRKKNWFGVRMAPYFIEKDGISVLEGYCQDILDRVSGETYEENKGFIDDI